MNVSLRASGLPKGKRLFLMFLGLLIVGLVLFMSVHRQLRYHWVHNHEIFEYSTSFNDEGLPSKTFLYLIQAECCIPNHMLQVDVLGDELACDCRIIVLSFKSKCLVDPPPHVKYISSNTSSTFTTGRSLLYTTAISRPVDYLYYIFLDDDVILYTKDRDDNINPWRWFESVLKRTQPPLAAIDLGGEWDLVGRIQQRRLERKDCSLDPSLTHDYLPAVFFDAIVNAFHRKAIRHILGPILPYWNKLDDVSWWYSQWYVYMITDTTFHGQAVLLTRIMTRNDIQRSYNRRMQDAPILQFIANDIRKLIPEKYTTVADGLLKAWVANYEFDAVVTTVQDTYCREPHSPNSSIVPFGWVDGISQGHG